MDETSIFPDKTAKPTNKDLADKLGSKFELWKQIHDMVLGKYPGGLAEWNYSDKNYGLELSD